MRRHGLTRQRRRVPARCVAGVKLAVHERHPRLAAAVAVEQPHAAGAALAFLDQRLDEGAEEAVDVGLAHHQIEGQLHGVALDACHAVGAALGIDCRRQLPFQLVCRARGYHPAVGDVEHALHYPASLPTVSIGRWTELSLIPKDDVPMDEAAVP